MGKPAIAVVISCICACGSSSPSASWEKVAEHLPWGATDVWGTSDSDVYVVGGSDQFPSTPHASHFDGTAWTTLTPPQVDANLWWVYGFEGGPVFMSGDNGTIFRFDPASQMFTKMNTPDIGTVFGVWGASPDDMWAVGGSGGMSGAFIWHLVGGQWTAMPLDPNIMMNESMWKVFGRSATDVWIVGTSGRAFHWDGMALSEMDAPTGGESLFTVHANDQKFIAVGGFASPIMVENDGSGWRDVSPQQGNGLVGVCLSPHGEYAVGQNGGIYKHGGADNDWPEVKTGLSLGDTFHAVWVSPTGEVWTVGGNVLIAPLSDGIVVHQGDKVPEGIQ